MWVYAHNGHKVGPVEFEEIVNQINAGVIVQTTPVCSSGEKPCRAGQHPKLQQFFAALNSAPATQTSPANKPANSDSSLPDFSQFSQSKPSSAHNRFKHSTSGIRRSDSVPDFSQLSHSNLTTQSNPTSNNQNVNSQTPQSDSVPDFAQLSPSQPSTGRSRFKRKTSGTRKKSSNSNQMMFIGIAVAVIVAIGLFFAINGGSCSSGLSNLVTSKVPKTVRFTDEDTVENLRPQAESGSIEAQFKLGMLLDDYESIKWYKKAANNGYAPAQVFCFLKLFGEDRDEAEIWIKKAADQKYPPALAICYVKGIGFEPDKDKARRTITSAAEEGDSIAQTLLGMFYINGGIISSSKDFSKARYWLHQAAEQGVPDAQISLWEEFEENKWVYALAKKGIVKMQLKYAQILLQEKRGIDTEGKAKIDEVVAWIRNAADNNNSIAQNFLGLFYFWGEWGFPKDRDMAYKWWKKSADNGNSAAKGFLRDNF